jgi:hypothetical protein
LNGDLIPQLNELGASSGFTFGTTNRYDPNLKWPVSNEYSLEVQRQLFFNTVLTVGYTNRQTRRNIGFRNVAVPIDTYIPLQVTEANSGRLVTVYNQAPALRGKQDNLYFNTDTANSDYNGRRHHHQQADVEQVVAQRRGQLRKGRSATSCRRTSTIRTPRSSGAVSSVTIRRGRIGRRACINCRTMFS